MGRRSAGIGTTTEAMASIGFKNLAAQVQWLPTELPAIGDGDHDRCGARH